MKKHTIELLAILEHTFPNCPSEYHCPDDIDLQSIIDEALAHDVLPLLYPVLRKVPRIDEAWVSFINELHRTVMMCAIEGKRLIHKAIHTISLLIVEGIPVIVVKGIVLRDLYQVPSLRTMGDVDILVPQECVNQCVDIMIREGYQLIGEDPKHMTFYIQGELEIELHWSLMNPVA